MQRNNVVNDVIDLSVKEHDSLARFECKRVADHVFQQGIERSIAPSNRQRQISDLAWLDRFWRGNEETITAMLMLNADGVSSPLQSIVMKKRQYSLWPMTFIDSYHLEVSLEEFPPSKIFEHLAERRFLGIDNGEERKDYHSTGVVEMMNG